MKTSLIGMGLLLAASPVVAQDPLAPLPEAPAQIPVSPPVAPVQPPQLPPADQPVPGQSQIVPRAQPAVQQPSVAWAPVVRPVVIPRTWRDVFAAIRAGDWAGAQTGIATLPSNVLTPVAKAELYTAKGSPPVTLWQIQSLLAEAPELPQAGQLQRLAMLRGAVEPPAIVPTQRMVGLGYAPRRNRARPVTGEPYADQLRTALDPLMKDNLAPEAEILLVQYGPSLSADARAEAAQRVAWAYYLLGRDMDARRVADYWRAGASSEWGPQAAWVSGLASWRINNCVAASRAFREVASTSRESELVAGAYYWAARSEQACRRPGAVAPLLKAAARNPESFYGLLARETLGMNKALPPEHSSRLSAVLALPNVRRAAELTAIGERWLAEDILRYQAKIGNPADHHGLIEFAKANDLAGAQFWLAHNGPRGATADPADRYPTPHWTPVRGWRVDPALVYAHIRQETNFRADAISPAGAIGLMQVMPGTASDMARAAGLAFSKDQIADPAFNLEYGQSWIEKMRASGATRGELPRVIAAYNAGPTPVSRWLGLYDKGDPLLWMESLSYWETRYYVPAVLRNMWVYQGLEGEPMPTLGALAQHRWPTFPETRSWASR
jgi:soluble lytic murein transglycosylase-like protein